MVTITQHPSETSFAGNPIILKARSGLSEKTFLKICAEVKISIYQRASLLSSFARTLSIPTNGGGETVVFDLSDLMQSALSQISMERNSTLSEGTPSFTSGYVRYTVEVWDEYLDYLAVMIANLRTVFDSDIIIGGDVGAYLEDYMFELGKKVMKYNTVDSDISYLKNSIYKKGGAAAGAALYYILQFIDDIS